MIDLTDISDFCLEEYGVKVNFLWNGTEIELIAKYKNLVYCHLFTNIEFSNHGLDIVRSIAIEASKDVLKYGNQDSND
jgi:hypothetical protein